MRQEISIRVSHAIAVSDQATDQTDSNWFAPVCKALLPKDAGFALHVVTGVEERSCYRYAAGDRKPSGDFIRALLRSEQGATWLAAIMDGSTAEWWRELQTARDLCSRYRVSVR